MEDIEVIEGQVRKILEGPQEEPNLFLIKLILACEKLTSELPSPLQRQKLALVLDKVCGHCMRDFAPCGCVDNPGSYDWF